MRASALVVSSIIALTHGPNLEYVERGDPDATAVVLLHGLTDSWRSWSAVLAQLPPTIRVIALSQRGHGGSERPASEYAPEHFAGDVVQCLDVLGVERAILVGHSMGAYVALRAATDHPGRVSGLVLVGAFEPRSGHPTMRAIWEDGFAELRDPIDPGVARAFQQSTVYAPLDPDFLDLVVAESLRVPARVWRASLLGMRDHGFADELGRIEVPTLLVWGDRDEIATSEDQGALLAAIPHAVLVVYEGTGHGAHWERPERFARDLVRFVQETSESR
jgi:non-heme chloroperoxidase